ncbi:hypothetical protein MSG28_015693 [Choristoneura fumiferana]|uniref:Uncharacterized protein n=1 Tax=Choristoneura fumiferana TaxID=7141 RepID=A0ACC0KB48_CHOFU|nr:hypothetical protein MSG28_015693 [Choristoneura fumiferana]
MSEKSPLKEIDHKNVTLTCEVADGNPRILDEVTWYLDGEVLKKLPECNNETDKALCDEVDPSMLLLQDTTRNPPGPAKLVYSPWRVVKGKSLILTCSIEELGRPETNR